MDRLEYRKKLRGNFLPVPAPFHDDFSLDIPTFRRQIRRLLEAGYRTGNGFLLVGGAAAEFYALETDERKRIAEAAVEEAAGRIPVIVGAQHSGSLTVLELARFAERIGADGIQVGPPYYEPPTADDVFELFQAVSDAADIPIVVYNTWWTGTNAVMDYDLTARLLEIANIGGLKWSSPSASTYEAVLRDFSPEVAIIDNQLCEVYAHMLGACGFTSHPPLCWPEYGLRFWACLEERRYEEATELLKIMRIPYYHLFWKAIAYSGCEAHFDKAMMELVGELVGPPRPPGRPLPASFREEMRQFLERAGVLKPAMAQNGKAASRA